MTKLWIKLLIFIVAIVAIDHAIYVSQEETVDLHKTLQTYVNDVQGGQL